MRGRFFAPLIVVHTPAEIGHNDAASSVLGCAAKVIFLPSFVRYGSSFPKYEEALRNTDDPSGTNHQAKACVTVVYLSTRMEAVRNSKPCDGGVDIFSIP